jgi:hypothetical protein
MIFVADGLRKRAFFRDAGFAEPINYQVFSLFHDAWTIIVPFTVKKQIAVSNTETVAKILATRVAGKITFAAQSVKLAGFACANITVVATSKDLLTHAPDEFSQPKWVRTGKARMIAGQCTYSINVPPNSAFYLSAGGQGRFACTFIGVSLSPTFPAFMSVPPGTTRTVDLVVVKVTCETLR